MRVARFLVVLGSLLVLCSTASDAHHATSTARVGLKKRFLQDLEAHWDRLAANEWKRMADEATQLVPPPPQRHFVQPDNARRRANPPQDIIATNEIRANQLHQSALQTDDLATKRTQAFGNVMSLLLDSYPYQPHGTFLARFLAAADAFDVLQRAAERRAVLGDADAFGSPYLGQHLRAAMWAALHSDSPRSFSSEELQVVITDAGKAATAFGNAKWKVLQMLEWDPQPFSRDQTGPLLTHLSQQLKQAEKNVWVSVGRLKNRLEEVELQEASARRQSASRYNGQGSSYDRQAWRYR